MLRGLPNFEEPANAGVQYACCEMGGRGILGVSSTGANNVKAVLIIIPRR